MKAFAAFENTVYQKKLERKVFAFCRRRQPKLLRYLPRYLAADVCRFFHGISREEYLRRRWSFLKDVEKPAAKLERFFHRIRRKLWLPPAGTEIVSDQPEAALAAFCEKHGYGLRANTYDAAACRFTGFRTERELISEDAPYAAYGTLHGPVMDGAAEKTYVYKKWTTTSRSSYKKELVLHAGLTYLAMLFYAVALGYLSLFYASLGAQDRMEQFRAYLASPALQLLNIAPIVLVMSLLYCIFNNSAISAFITTVLTIVPTWISCFKMKFRGDPFVFDDILFAKEAAAMTNSYRVVLSKGMILVIVGAVCAVALFIVFLRYHSRKPLARGIVAVALLIVSFAAYKNVYLSDEIYDATYHQLSFQSDHNTSDRFQNHGFIYPFLHSVSDVIDTNVTRKNIAAGKRTLSQYDYADIPEGKKVNVIACMLESYSDFTRFDELTFTEDPYEFWHELQKESYSGTTLSYAFGGGTIIPERQFLTGLTEFPSFRRTTNSYAWYFRQQGYTVEGSHPYYHWFYDRSTINRRLGFENYYFDEDTYEALNGGEPMSHDSVLFPHIVELYEQATARGENYFSFNVTFQGHGPYFSDAEYDHPYVENKGYSEESYNYLNNYLAIADDVDDALKDMVQSLRESEEPVVLILFGDHMPSLGDKNSAYGEFGISLDLASDEGFYNYYSTPYVIWANDEAKRVLGNDFVGEGPTIGTNFLMNEFFRLAGYTGNEYMQYTADLMQTFQCIHSTWICLTPEGLCRELSPAQEEAYEEFMDVQYYWRSNYQKK